MNQDIPAGWPEISGEQLSELRTFYDWKSDPWANVILYVDRASGETAAYETNDRRCFLHPDIAVRPKA